MAQVKGNDLIVYMNSGGTETAIACSTTCTLNIAQELVDSTCKDSGGWANNIEGLKSWSVDVDGLYVLPNVWGFIDISDLIVSSDDNTVTITFGNTGPLKHYWQGTARLASTSLSGDSDQGATYSASFTGYGALTRTEV